MLNILIHQIAKSKLKFYNKIFRILLSKCVVKAIAESGNNVNCIIMTSKTNTN